MPPDIEALANSFLINPAHVEVTPPATTVERIDQSIYFVEKGQKPDLLEHLLNDPSVRRALVFTRTKHGANKVVKQLATARIQAAAIHGNKSQSAREQALAGFRSGSIPVLVATDIAARGIDVDGITHVINYDLPNVPETYVHRIGRTARAGADGVAYSFCDLEEREYLRDIEKTIRMRIPVAAENPYMSPMGLPGEVQLRPGHPLYNGQNAPKAQPKVQSKPASARPQDRPGQQQSASNGGGQASQTARPVGNASTTSGQRQSNGSGTSNPQPRAASASNGSSGTPGAPGAGTSSSAARRRRRRNRSRANGASAQTNPQRAPERG
jgi:ATP-dependent RNA helicase RhlE